MANKLFLIGIDKYLHHKQLNSSVRDVTDFKNILLEKYDFTEENIYELLNERATNKNIQDALNGYSKTITGEDNLVIYYSGHGDHDDKSDRGFWVPFDGKKDYTTWIPNEIIITLLSKITCKHIFLICDSCFSNSLLIASGTKSGSDYFKHSSRWALTSAYAEAIDSDEFSNTLFAETIISYLENADHDVRISELIEEVKRVFLDNRLQHPQGYPLAVRGHRGGEFIFVVKHDVDKRNLRGYSDFKNTLQLYKRKSLFLEMSTFEDKTKKIGFQLFQDVDSVMKKATYYLYLYEGINQIQTLKYLQQNFPQIFREKNLLIFVPKDKKIQNPEARKRNISDKFKPINIFFIDDFIREHCTPKIIQDEEVSKFLNISNFVLPVFNGRHGNESINKFLSDWFEQDNEPILIVKGTGGIGKTTFSQYVADKAQSKFPNISILFIDSVLIKDTLLKSKQNGNFSIYNFYEALFEITDSISEKLSEDVFRINVDAGNLLLLIDGLDEVISKIPNFDVEDFIGSITNSSSSLGNGKVIITCRTHFWNIVDSTNDRFKIIELEPFNSDQAKLFFEKSFKTDEAKIRRALKLANEFRYPKSRGINEYDPYVLDIIRSLINTSQESIETDLSLFSSKLLNNSIKNDYIIYRVCDRERKRIGQISVDDQVLFFTYLSVEKRGVIRFDNIGDEITSALNKHVDLTHIEAFKSHPFLKSIDSTITFRYDFLGDLFKSIYLASYFDYSRGKFEITTYLIDAVIDSCWFGSPINQDIVNRTSHWNDDDILLVYDLIEQLNKKEDIPIAKRRKATANIFNLSMALNERHFGTDIYKCTELLKKLFLTNTGKIENLCIVNIGADQNVRFDFSGLTIYNAYIDNYGNFWDSVFDDNTRFIKCHFINSSLKRKTANVSKSNFIDCTADHEMEASLNKIELNSTNRLEQTKVFLNDFFHLFFSNGRLGRQWEHKIIQPRYYGINKYNHEYKKTVRILKRHNVLVTAAEKEGIKFYIHDDHKEDVIRFIKDGTISTVINNIIKDLSI